MKYELPENHGLSAQTLEDENLLHRRDGSPSLTDIQHAALAEGVARGNSMLVVAPTSTGKTHIAVWAMLSWLINGEGQQRSVVYLVTHRALARQKFDDFKYLLVERYLYNDPTALVLATGDGCEDGRAEVVSQPLEAPVLVATYEKYLGLLAGRGIPNELADTLVVCDEVQIIGEPGRGRNVEELLTLLCRASIGQMVALSAVIDKSDAQTIAEWLEVSLVHTSVREKHLTYECWGSSSIQRFKTDEPELGIQRVTAPSASPRTATAFAYNLFKSRRGLPAVVFCTSKPRVYKAKDDFCRMAGLSRGLGARILSFFSEETEAAQDLSWLLEKRVAYHTADMLQDERRVVEERLKKGEIDVVFSTTTLAAGVNFSFTTAIFDSWKFFDYRIKKEKPIENPVFQNMAGRAGRMDSEEDRGHVVFFAEDNFLEQQSVRTYLNPDAIPRLKTHLTPECFSQIALNLLASGVCRTSDEVYNFLLGSLSAFREQQVNKSGLDHWREKTNVSIQELRDWGFIL